MQTIPDALLPVIQLGAFGLLSLGFIWSLTKLIPMYFETERERAKQRRETAEAFVGALERSREYHRQDSDLLRGAIDAMVTTFSARIADLALSVERNTIAHVASAKGLDPQEALDKFGNGGKGDKTR